MSEINWDRIEHPAAYAAAVKRNIILNARKTFLSKYPDASVIIDYVESKGITYTNGCAEFKQNFFGSLAGALAQFGKLTEGQVNAVRKCMAVEEARRQEWADKRAAENATKQFVGTRGEKITVTVTLKKRVWFESDYGSSAIHILADEAGNTLIYKGIAAAMIRIEEGSTFQITGTVKEHGTRNGERQTILQRPKVA